MGEDELCMSVGAIQIQLVAISAHCHLRSDKNMTGMVVYFSAIDTNYVQMFDNQYFNFHYCRRSFIFI